MGSETTVSLPVVDFGTSDLKPGTPEWNSLRCQVRKASEEYGCFELVTDKVSLEHRKAVIVALEELFNLPLETKLRSMTEIRLVGYNGQIAEVPLFESIGLLGANNFEEMEKFTNLMWPQGNPSFSKTIQSYSEQLSEIDGIIRRMILESFGLEKYLEEHMNSAYYIQKVIRYNGPQSTEKMLGLKTHTDKGFLTVLYQNQVDGLEILSKDGEWISVKLSPKSFFIIIAESLNALVNGLLYSPPHRVMMTGNITRYSTGLSTFPKAGYIVKAAEELVDEEHPIVFKPYDFHEFFKFYITDAGQQSENPLKDYCGA